VSGYGKVTAAALVVVPGPNGEVTFIRQERGPYAGNWLLPGGRIEFGELTADAARRETLEESGCDVGDLVPTGAYEMHGEWTEGKYHLIMFAFRAQAPCVIPADFSGHHVGEIVQRHTRDVVPHPTVMQILNDAGVADYPQSEIDAGLASGGVRMVALFGSAKPAVL
jgi:8-oxo-dGTP diphosphatase